MKLDVLAIAAHPDDVELGCSGTLCKLVAQGRKVGILDLTRGELGSRGTAETRRTEAAEAAAIMGVSVRENLGLPDGFFGNTEAEQRAVITVLRRFQPAIVLGNAPDDRHPDHGRGAKLVRDACFLSGLRRIETAYNGAAQQHWRPAKVLHYIQDRYLPPALVVDISPYWDQKLKAIQSFKTQFFDAASKEPETYISRSNFLDFIRSRAREMGHKIGAEYGEGFISVEPLKIDDLLSLAPAHA
jgi:bacillithiol biosynthesis deacetylase BshB1